MMPPTSGFKSLTWCLNHLLPGYLSYLNEKSPFRILVDIEGNFQGQNGWIFVHFPWILVDTFHEFSWTLSTNSNSRGHFPRILLDTFVHYNSPFVVIFWVDSRGHFWWFIVDTFFNSTGSPQKGSLARNSLAWGFFM